MRKNTVKPGLTRNRRTNRSGWSRQSRSTRVRVLVLLARFVSGRPMNGRRDSNATFFTAGTRRMGRPAYLITCTWWALAAGWQRAAIRLTACGWLAFAVMAEVVR